MEMVVIVVTRKTLPANIFSEILSKVSQYKKSNILNHTHYKSAAKLGHGSGYLYAHDYPNNYVKQQYLPYELNGKEFYHPSGNGYEVKIKEHMSRLKREAAEPDKKTNQADPR